MFKHLLVPTDGSPFSNETVRRAITFAKEAGIFGIRSVLSVLLENNPITRLYGCHGF